MSETILLVDDTFEEAILVSESLKDFYNVIIAENGKRALEIAKCNPEIDLILLDTQMPEMDGYEVCKCLKENKNTRGIPVIFLTETSHQENEQHGIDLGAVDYITKTVSVAILKSRIKNYLQLKNDLNRLTDLNQSLIEEEKRQSDELITTKNVVFLALTALAEARDNDTGHHILRTQTYIKLLAERLESQGKFEKILTESYIDMLYQSAALHDIGKVAISDSILLKPGKLTEDEFEVMKSHSEIGAKVIENIENRLGANVDFLQCAKEIVLYHHEKWNGTGYPSGICGDEIPLAARLMAVVDVYDALTSERVYKSAMSHEKAVGIINSESGIHFDPEIVNAFLGISNEFAKVSEQFKDNESFEMCSIHS